MSSTLSQTENPKPSQNSMTPPEIVQVLDRHIIGQHDAKRAVAIALRNRWRRMQLPEVLAKEITPSNILMIGPTGVGKTEIARRLAALANAPFIKVEATKFTEVGYVGKDVESIIRDLVELAIKTLQEQAIQCVQERAKKIAEDRVLDAVLASEPKQHNKAQEKTDNEESPLRKMFRKKLREGKLDEREIEIDVPAKSQVVEIISPHGMEEITGQLQGMFQSLLGDRKKRHKLKIKEALRFICDHEASLLINQDEIRAQALKSVEENGIVFIDEIDKIAQARSEHGGIDVSRAGVQRDILPLIEGCTVHTKYGMIKTDHILFIASGAFHLSKPSDLLPELQGRLPVRVELQALTVADFKQILTEPDSSLIEQHVALMGTEKFDLSFSEDAIARIAEISFYVNESTENIGARRLRTVLEKVLELASFEAASKPGQSLKIDAKYVDTRLSTLLKNEDLSRYIL